MSQASTPRGTSGPSRLLLSLLGFIPSQKNRAMPKQTITVGELVDAAQREVIYSPDP